MAIRSMIRAVAIVCTLISLCLLPAGLAAADDCTSCHGTSGGYTFEYMSLSFKTTRVVSKDTEFEHIVEVRAPGKYKAQGVTVTVDLSTATGCTMVSAKSQSLGDMTSGTKTVIFVIKAQSSALPQKIRTSLQYTAVYHYTPTKYTEVGVITVTIGKYLLQPSNWSVEVTKGKTYTLSLTANEGLKNLTLMDSAELDKVATVSDPHTPSMDKGASMDLIITGKQEGSGVINVAYQDGNGTPYLLSVEVTVRSQAANAAGWGLWGIVGFWCGIASILVLLFSAALGMPFKAVKLRLNKILGSAQTRTKFHCGISYIVLCLALLHGVVVMAHWWSGLILGSTFILAQILDWRGYIVNLGVLSWGFMVLVSVSGVAQKPLIKALSFKGWRFSHMALTKLALLAGLVHGAVHLYIRLTGG